MTHAIRRRVLLAVALAGALVAGTERVQACSCVSSGPPCEATWKTDGVFVGQVESLTPVTEPEKLGSSVVQREMWRVRMKVSEVFRGTVGGEVDVFTSTSGASCGYDFSRTRTYLVYAYWMVQTQRWGAGICSRTRPVSEAAEDLAYLRAAVRSPGTLGVLQGKAEHMELVDTEYGRMGRGRPYPGLRIDIELVGGLETRRYQATTSASGEYSVQVPVGRYRLTPALPPSLYVYAPAVVDLRDPRGCASFEFAVRSNGRIAGRVVDSDSRPVPYLPVQALPASAARQPYYNSNDQTLTDANGDFEFTRLEPDRYRLGLDLRREPRAVESALWFVDEPDKVPFEVSLGREERVFTRSFTLPASLSLAMVSGRVVDENGRPVAGGRVYLQTAPAFRTEAQSMTTPTGEFRFNARAERQYRVLVESYGDERPFRRAQSEVFEAKSGREALELRLKPVK